MMNALPLPPGPMEIPGGALKPDRRPPNSDRYRRAEDNDSFASTLKAVHDDSRAKSESTQARTDERYDGDDVTGTKAKRSRINERETSSGEASEQAMQPSDTPPKNPEAAENPSASVSEMNAAAPAESECAPKDGHQDHAGITLRSGAQIKHPTRDGQNAAGKSPEAANAQKITPEAEMIGNECNSADGRRRFN